MTLLLYILLLGFWCDAAFAVRSTPDREFIGWLGESYGNKTDPQDPPRMEVLSWDPRIFLFHHFLSEDECTALVDVARPRMTRSGVSNAVTGAGETSDIRTSSGMFFARGEIPAVRAVEKRIAMWTMLPDGNGEGIQVLHYEKTQKYDPHHDYFSFKGADDNGGNRMATVLMYLTDVEEGGETVFPKVPPPPGQVASPCGSKGLSVKPRRGSAVVFWSIRPDGTFDAKSLHGSCPVIKGEKWSATKWIHVGHYAMDGERQQAVVRHMYVPPPPPIPENCKNQHDLCDHWAESGECEANPVYMVGVRGAPGACLAACARCELLDPV